jgi:predicted anti-sigma-YlaC factor YlaD
MNNLCAEVRFLLPWFVNKSLETEQKVVIYSHLTVCSQCREDFAFFVDLQQTVHRFMARPDPSVKKEIF